MSDAWFIIKLADGPCQIVPDTPELTQNDAIAERWGPFDTQETAIARRIGLIRAGKCQPQQPQRPAVTNPETSI